jgi:hypothetical protein
MHAGARMNPCDYCNILARQKQTGIADNKHMYSVVCEHTPPKRCRHCLKTKVRDIRTPWISKTSAKTYGLTHVSEIPKYILTAL